MYSHKLAELMFEVIPLLDRNFVRPVDQQFRTITSSSQISALGILAKKNATMTELSGEMLMSKQQMTPIVDKLVEKKLVERIYDKGDRRAITISITPEGLDMLTMVKEQALRILEEKFKQLDNTDRENLYKALAEVYRIIDKV